ncbi:MAG: hypothetical protein NUV56_00035 [Candidatus Uhrbacteria bacterium]|nr:hypothetical protein [Candidatus Uhrbacteria bacterium]
MSLILIVGVLIIALAAAGTAVGYTKQNEELLAVSLLVLFILIVGVASMTFRNSIMVPPSTARPVTTSTY